MGGRKRKEPSEHVPIPNPEHHLQSYETWDRENFKVDQERASSGPMRSRDYTRSVDLNGKFVCLVLGLSKLVTGGGLRYAARSA